MIRLIHKQLLPMKEDIELMLPVGAKVLSIGVQGELPYMWYEFHPDEEENTSERNFVMLATGRPTYVPRVAEYIGSFMLYEGEFVGHIYELGRVDHD